MRGRVDRFLASRSEVTAADLGDRLRVSMTHARRLLREAVADGRAVRAAKVDHEWVYTQRGDL